MDGINGGERRSLSHSLACSTAKKPVSIYNYQIQQTDQHPRVNSARLTEQIAVGNILRMVSQSTGMQQMKTALMAGHICLDIIPEIPEGHGDLLAPGRLVQMGSARISTGGSVSNTGLGLYKLGIPISLIAKVGEDVLGTVLRSELDHYAPSVSSGIQTTNEAGTSYSIIISPAGLDRTFWHYPGANDTYCASDIDDASLARADLFHFGYPPVMRRMYANGGIEMEEMFRRAKRAGTTTSLDMCFPDDRAESGRTDWRAILSRTLPYIDIFLPSADELFFMLHYPLFFRLNQNQRFNENLTLRLVGEISTELLEMGAKIIIIKLGERGLYLRTAKAEKIANMGRAAPFDPTVWGNLELYQPCFDVNVIGTTGSGDATIAGFLAALLRGLSPAEAMTIAVAVGACNVESADALSGIRTWDDTLARIKSNWVQKSIQLKR
jgi:sugar/nucleoside kinase (ribokinase family)